MLAIYDNVDPAKIIEAVKDYWGVIALAVPAIAFLAFVFFRSAPLWTRILIFLTLVFVGTGFGVAFLPHKDQRNSPAAIESPTAMLAPVLSQTTPRVTTTPTPALTPLPTTLPSTATPAPVASTAASRTPLPAFETQKMVLPDKDQRRLKEILVSFLGYTSTEISLDLFKQKEMASLLVHQADLCSQRWLDENSGDHGIEKIFSQNYRAKDLWQQIFYAIFAYKSEIEVANTDIDDPAASPGLTALALKDGESARQSIDRCVRNLAGYVGISL